MAIIDLLSILPFFLPVNPGFKTLRLLRMACAFRAIRFIRESHSYTVIGNVLKREKGILLSVDALVGVALIALLAGIITGGHIEEMRR